MAKNKPVNKYKGEFNMSLYGVQYPMQWTAATQEQFRTETGTCPYAFLMGAWNSINELREEGAFDMPDAMQQTVVMAKLTSRIGAREAAWIFYIAAHACDKMVTFEEIQEAVLHEGITFNKLNPGNAVVATYPYLVIEFAEHVFGIGRDEEQIDNLKKKKPNSIPSLLNVFRSQK